METYKGEPNNLDWDKSNLNYGSEFHDVVPLYTQDQLEEARKLGMQQEQALWELAASTQEIMDTHSIKELNDGGEPVKNATYWKRQYNLMASQNDNLKSGLYHANEQIKYLESHPVKEEAEQQSYQEQDGCPTELAVLQRFWRKAQEK